MNGPVDIHRLILDLHAVSMTQKHDEPLPDPEFLRELCCRSLVALGQVGYGHREQVLALGQRLIDVGQRIMDEHHAN